MNFALYQKRLTYIYVQRNILIGLVVVILIIMLMQSSLLFFKQEKVIIVPPELKQSYWVQGNKFSDSYLEEMALFFSHLLLDVTESNILPQGDILLRYVQPECYGEFKTKLLQDVKRLKSQQLSLQFTPATVQVIGPLTLEVKGLLSNYVGSKKISQIQETYQIVFSHKKGRLFLNSFQMIKTEG